MPIICFQYCISVNPIVSKGTQVQFGKVCAPFLKTAVLRLGASGCSILLIALAKSCLIYLLSFSRIMLAQLSISVAYTLTQTTITPLLDSCAASCGITVILFSSTLFYLLSSS